MKPRTNPLPGLCGHKSPLKQGDYMQYAEMGMSMAGSMDKGDKKEKEEDPTLKTGKKSQLNVGTY